jgi:hypothetical protein
MKFAVTITIILNAILYLISNYNSKGTLNRDLNRLSLSRFTNINILKYKHLRAKKTIDKMLL